jgi:hypothetical protein
MSSSSGRVGKRSGAVGNVMHITDNAAVAETALRFDLVDAQPYTDCCFSAGLVFEHPHDTIYLKFERDGEEPTLILLRNDEAVRIAGLLSNAVWAELLLKRLDARAQPKDLSEPGAQPGP